MEAEEDSMNENDILKELAGNKAKAKAKAKGLSSKQIDRLISALNEVKIEAQEQEEYELKVAEAKREKAEKLLELMAESGLDIDDLINNKAATPKPPKQKVPPKYRAIVDGEKIEWTGRGRMPSALKSHIESSGLELETFLIKQ